MVRLELTISTSQKWRDTNYPTPSFPASHDAVLIKFGPTDNVSAEVSPAYSFHHAQLLLDLTNGPVPYCGRLLCCTGSSSDSFGLANLVACSNTSSSVGIWNGVEHSVITGPCHFCLPRLISSERIVVGRPN